MLRIQIVIIFVTFIVLSTSCGNIKNLQYLQGSFDTVALSKIPVNEPLIQKGDLLGIAIYSDDPLSTAAVTNPSVPAVDPASQNNATNTSGTSGQGYLVNQEGNIQLYKLGFIHAEGMTKKQLSDTLAELYKRKQLLINPYIEIRFLNYRITLIGEVNKPGTYTVPTEKINAFEAIGLAGDITVYGKRNNVLVVRETNGVRKFGYLDLSKPDVFLSPYYYLQQNDMVIINVSKNKAAVNDQVTARNITIAASVLSTIAIFLNIFTR